MMLGRLIVASAFGLVGLIVCMLAGGSFLLGATVYSALGSGLFLLIALREFTPDGRSITPSSWNFLRAGSDNPDASPERHIKKN